MVRIALTGETHNVLRHRLHGKLSFDKLSRLREVPCALDAEGLIAAVESHVAEACGFGAVAATERRP